MPIPAVQRVHVPLFLLQVPALRYVPLLVLVVPVLLVPPSPVLIAPHMGFIAWGCRTTLTKLN